jgi:predicted N-acetyltransferase YhbS
LCLVLHILAVLPEYQGRGTGSKLIREGLEVVDEKGWPVWLGATVVALPLYKKVGFEVDYMFEFDMAPYGGNTVEKHIIMIRPAAVKGKD